MRDLTIKITTETAQAEAGLKRVDAGLANVEKKSTSAGQATDGLQLSMTRIAQAAGGYVAIEHSLENLTGFAQSSLSAFAEQEAAVSKLTTALRAQGTATPEVIAQYDALATQFQQTTVFGDDLIQQMQALLVQVGNVMPDQMQDALTAATNLSAGLGVDLRTATMLVGKAFEGNTGTLKRYGIVVDENKLKTEGITAVLEAVNQKFGGQAQAQLETYSGKVENLSNRWNDFQERLGGLIATALTPLLDLFERMPSALQTVVFGVGALTAILAPLAGGVMLVAQAFGVSLIPLLTGAFVSAWGGIVTLITGTVIPLLTTALPMALRGLAMLLTPPAGLIVAGILAVVAIWRNWDTIKEIVASVYTAVKTWMVDKFNAVVESIRTKVNAVTGFFKDMYEAVVGHSYVPDMITGVEVHFARLESVMVSPTRSATDAVMDMFHKMAGNVVSRVQPMFDGLASGIRTHFPSIFGGAGLFSQLMSTGLSSIFGPGGIAATLVMQGVEQLGQLAWKGLKKIGGFFKNLFGGPDKDEIAGRSVVAAFENNIDTMLTEAQRVEAGNDAWKKTVIFIRDEYLKMGLSQEEALADAARLWDSSKDGAEAAARVIEDIKRKYSGGISVPITFPTVNAPATPEVPLYHRGGLVDWPRAHRGLAMDEVPIVALRGEGVLNRGAMARIGGARGLNALNRGGGMGGTVVTVNVAGYLDSKASARRLAGYVRQELDADIQRRQRMSRG